MDFLFTEAVGIIVTWNYVRKPSCLHLWFGLTFQLLPLLYLIKAHNAPLSRTGFDLNMCYFYFNFNRKLFIQHINHKILQNVRLYHATIIRLHSVVGKLGSLPFHHLPWPRTPPSGYHGALPPRRYIQLDLVCTAQSLFLILVVKIDYAKCYSTKKLCLFLLILCCFVSYPLSKKGVSSLTLVLCRTESYLWWCIAK